MSAYRDDQEEIYANKVRAGKRTYFFDVRSTKSNEYYLTITESKKVFDEDGNHSFKKHKIFLYKEDFEKFKDAYLETIKFINENNESRPKENDSTSTQDSEDKSFTDVDFEDI